MEGVAELWVVGISKTDKSRNSLLFLKNKNYHESSKWLPSGGGEGTGFRCFFGIRYLSDMYML